MTQERPRRRLPDWIACPQPPQPAIPESVSERQKAIAEAALHILDTAIDDEDPDFDIERDLLPELGDDVTEDDLFAVLRRPPLTMDDARLERLRTDACELAHELRRALLYLLV